MEVAAKLGTELALSALSPLLNKLSSKFGGDVTDEEMQHLNDFIRYEIAALTREAKSDDLVQSMPLLEKLQAAALELEDLLDLYEYNQIKKQVSSSSSSNPIKKFIPNFKEKLGPILPKSTLRIGLEKLLKFVEQVEKKHPFITSRTGITQPQANTFTPTTSTLLSPYFGRKNQCDSIIDFLLDESHADSSKRTNKVPVIAIIGMGGSGKSHTAQRICNDDRIKNRFDANMWIHVTRDFDVVGLTRQMLESAINDGHNQITSLDVLQKKLIESLSNRKKFLLVLDDVWCEDKMKWDLLIGPLNEAAKYGSKIIITTRTEYIADNLHANKFHLEELKVEECWLVLKHYAFCNYEEIIDDQELIDVGNQIINKVKHSPLALRVVGSSLSNKRCVNEWEKILQQDILKETMDLLLFSYQCLPLHLQRCFAYCSLFPKGYEFYFDVCSWQPHLISLWIAQGFIENTNKLTLEEAGMKYIEQLLSYSFFEKKSEYYFVVHDLLHDLAENVSNKQCYRIEHHNSLHVSTTCIHLSLCKTQNLVSIDQSTILAISDIFNLRNLRSLIILQHTGCINISESKKDVFQNLTKLRALYVDSEQQIKVLSARTDKLKHLRYLHVRYYGRLPVSLTKLYQLQFFILFTDQGDNNAHLLANTLPEGLSNLINLRTLQFYSQGGKELDYLYYNSKMINIEKLTLLQNLKKFHVDGFNGMISLRNLPLCGSLSILNLENVKCNEEADNAMLNQKNNINELIFEWSKTPSSIDTCEEVLEGLEPNQNVEKLVIKGYQGVKFPKWMVKENWLPRLQTLHLQSCTSLKIVLFLPPRLQQLYVWECDELMQLPPLSDTLHILKLCGCPKLQALTNLSPTVIDLIIVDCPKLMPPSMFNNSSSHNDLSLLTNLEHLCLRGLPNLQVLTNLSTTIKILTIDDCPKLTSLGNLQRCTSLQRLMIFKCPMLKREEPSLVEGVVEGDIANRLPQVEDILTDEPLLILELVQQQAFSSIRFLTLRGLQRSFLRMSDKCFHQFSSLTRLHLKDCAALPNLEKLSSLEHLNISDCRDVELLPNLPVSLQSLQVDDCPKMKEKYEEGGPLRNTISHIPHINIH